MKQRFRILPEALQERFQRLFDKETLEKLYSLMELPQLTTLRINTLKISREQFLSEIQTDSIVLKPVPFYADAFILESPTLREFSEHPLYKDGTCYVQSLSSMLPPLILNPQKDEKVLDLCAAPGSKTTQLAMLMNNTGEIVANDASHTRIYRLRANLERQGVTNTRTIRGVGQGLWHEYPEYFDKTLVDVPCSMEGRISLIDPDTYSDWSTKKIKELQEVQKFLLRSAISATKVGGDIVYSTCTLAPEENEGVIDWILQKEKGNVSLEEITMNDVPFYPAVTSWNQKVYSPEIAKTKRILPTQLFEGFYIAKLKKVASNNHKSPLVE